MYSGDIRKMIRLHFINDITIFDLVTTHTLISAQSSNFIVFKLQLVYFYLLLFKSICVGSHLNCLNLPQQVEAIHMKANSIMLL